RPPEKVMTQRVCPACRKKLPEGEVTRCSACGANFTARKPAPAKPAPTAGKRVEVADSERAPELRPKKRRKKAERAGLSKGQKIGLLAGGVLLLGFVLIGGLVFFLVRKGNLVGPGPAGGGRYVVVDSLPPPPDEPAEEAPPLDTEDALGGVWSV